MSLHWIRSLSSYFPWKCHFYMAIETLCCPQYVCIMSRTWIVPHSIVCYPSPEPLSILMVCWRPPGTYFRSSWVIARHHRFEQHELEKLTESGPRTRRPFIDCSLKLSYLDRITQYRWLLYLYTSSWLSQVLDSPVHQSHVIAELLCMDYSF